MQIIEGYRAGTCRYHNGDGFFYHQQRATGGRLYLRCALYRSNPPCPVRAVAHADLSNFAITSGMHNHGPDEFHIRVMNLRRSLIEACRVRPNIRVDLVYHEVCRRCVQSYCSITPVNSLTPFL